jgi:hypothetical protein
MVNLQNWVAALLRKLEGDIMASHTESGDLVFTSHQVAAPFVGFGFRLVNSWNHGLLSCVLIGSSKRIAALP